MCYTWCIFSPANRVKMFTNLAQKLSKICHTPNEKKENVIILKTNHAGSKNGGIFVNGRFSHDVPIFSDICIVCHRNGSKWHIVTNNTTNESVVFWYIFHFSSIYKLLHNANFHKHHIFANKWTFSLHLQLCLGQSIVLGWASLDAPLNWPRLTWS